MYDSSAKSPSGSLLIGSLLSMALWGVVCVQTFDYIANNNDRLLQRSIVALLWTIDTLSSAMDSHFIYWTFVTNYGNTGLVVAPWTASCHALVAGISNFIIRTMFARRIYLFKKNIIISIWIMSISFGDLVLSILLTIGLLQASGTAVSGLLSIKKLAVVSFTFGVVADLSVTVALCRLPQSAKSGFRRSDTIVKVFMAYVVNTGVLVTIVATLGLITFLADATNGVFYAFMILVNKLYVNSYLASLNTREKLGGMDSTSNSSVPRSRLDLSRSRGRVIQFDEKTTGIRTQAMAISLHTTVEQTVDEGENKITSHPDVV